MPVITEDMTLNKNLFIRLREHIFEKHGLYYKDADRALFNNRLCERLEALKIKSCGDYFDYLRNDPDGPAELSRLLDLIAASETKLAGNISQIHVLRSRILPALAEMKRAGGDYGLVLWSLAADGGQEAYTLAMTLREVLGEEISRWDACVYAMCPDHEKLEQAKAARYKDLSLRKTPTEFRTRHFRRDRTSFIVRDNVRDMVRFSLSDPNDTDGWEMPSPADIVFARDFLSRFHADKRRELLRAIHGNMRPGGFLFVAPNESLGNSSQLFTTIFYPKAIAYKALIQKKTTT